MRNLVNSPTKQMRSRCNRSPRRFSRGRYRSKTSAGESPLWSLAPTEEALSGCKRSLSGRDCSVSISIRRRDRRAKASTQHSRINRSISSKHWRIDPPTLKAETATRARSSIASQAKASSQSSRRSLSCRSFPGKQPLRKKSLRKMKDTERQDVSSNLN